MDSNESSKEAVISGLIYVNKNIKQYINIYRKPAF